MENDKDILNELNSWNSPLARLSRVMPYHVPQNYFTHDTSYLFQNVDVTYLETQQYYLAKQGTYKLPEGYFEQLPDQILETVTGNIAGNWTKGMPYQAPKQYFELLPKQVTAAAQNRSALDELPKQVPYSVPEDYFASLPLQATQAALAASAKAAAAVIPLGRRIWLQVKWSAAALLLLGTSFGILEHDREAPINAEKSISRLPTTSIDAYINQHIDDLSTDMFITSSNIPTGNTDKRTAANLQDDEILNYLDKANVDQTDLE